MANKTIIQFEDGQLTNSDYFLVWDIETGTNRKVKTSDILSNISGTTINGLTGSSITLKTDDITDVGQLNKYVSSDQINKINIIKSNQPSNTYLAGDGQYREITTTNLDDLTYNNITARDSDIGNIPENKRVLVLDASDDPTVDAGAALYYKNDQGSFTKLAENEGLDINFSSGTSYTFGDGLSESGGVVSFTGATPIITSVGNGLTNASGVISLGGSINQNVNLNGYRGISIGYGNTISSTRSNPIAMGYCSRSSCNHSLASGRYAYADGNYSVSIGYFSGAYASYSFAFGSSARSCGTDGITMSRYSTNLANRGLIIGGCNNTISAGNVGAAIVGGSGVNLTGNTYIGTTAVSKLAIINTPSSGSTSDTALVRDAATGIIKQVPQPPSFTYRDGVEFSSGCLRLGGNVNSPVRIDALGRSFSISTQSNITENLGGSSIFGGEGNSINSNVLRATIVGGRDIAISGNTYNDFTIASKVAIIDTPSTGVSGDAVLVRNSSTGIIKQVSQSSLAGGGGSTSFSGLTDTSFSGVTNGDIVKYNGTNWINENINNSFATPIDKAASEDLTQSIDFSLATIQPKTHSGTTTITGITNSELGTTVIVITGGDDVAIDSGVIPAERIRGAFDNTKTTNVLKVTNYDAINGDYYATWELVGGSTSSGGSSAFLEAQKNTTLNASITVADITGFNTADEIDGSDGTITYNDTTGVFTLAANTKYSVGITANYEATAGATRSTIDVQLTDDSNTLIWEGFNYIRDAGDKNTVSFNKVIEVGGTPLDVKFRHIISKGGSMTITLNSALVNITQR